MSPQTRIPTDNMLNSKVVLKYLAVHVTELVVIVAALIVVRNLVGIPTWLVVTIPVLWILKDIVLYPKVWRSYAFADNRPVRRLIGLEATVMYSLDPVGYVKVNGELWKAQNRDPRRPAGRGDRARVVDIQGTTLMVEGLERSPAGPSEAID